MMRGLRLRYSLLMGLGAAILASSRPYEGGAMCLGVGAVALAWLFGKQGPPLASSLVGFFLPMALMLSLTATGIGYYFFRVTGSPFRSAGSGAARALRRGADLPLGIRRSGAGVPAQSPA